MPNFGLRVRERAGTVADFGCGGGRYRLRSTSHGAIFSDLSVRAVGAFGCAVCGGEKEKGSSDAKVQSDEPKIENMDGCLTKSEHGVGASSALVLRLCRDAAARRGVVVWTMAEERRRATARWWFSVGKGEGQQVGTTVCRRMICIGWRKPSRFRWLWGACL